jgi:hypothetical protein
MQTIYNEYLINETSSRWSNWVKPNPTSFQRQTERLRLEAGIQNLYAVLNFVGVKGRLNPLMA